MYAAGYILAYTTEITMHNYTYVLVHMIDVPCRNHSLSPHALPLIKTARSSSRHKIARSSVLRCHEGTIDNKLKKVISYSG